MSPVWAQLRVAKEHNNKLQLLLPTPICEEQQINNNKSIVYERKSKVFHIRPFVHSITDHHLSLIKLGNQSKMVFDLMLKRLEANVKKHPSKQAIGKSTIHSDIEPTIR